MMHVPVLHDLVGNPAGVRVEVRRLVDAAESVGVASRILSDLNQQAVQAWESHAQRMFSTLATTVSQVIGGSGSVTSDMADALDRYANILEVCQNDVRVCRQRLQSLVTSTPAGMVPDPTAVNTIVGQANDAYARAGQAGRELSAVALNLMGSPTAHGSLPAPGDASASFVSHAHSGGLASTHPSAAAFDVRSAHIQAQMSGVMNSLTGLVTSQTSPVSRTSEYHPLAFTVTLGSGSVIAVDPTAAPSNPLTIQNPITPPTLTVQIPGSQPWADPDDLVMVTPPYAAGGAGPMGILVNTSMVANPAGPKLKASDAAYQLAMLQLSKPRSPWIEDLLDRPGAIDIGLENDTYNRVLDRNDDPWDNI